MSDRRRALLEMLGETVEEVANGSVIGVGLAIVNANGTVTTRVGTDDGLHMLAAATLLQRECEDATRGTGS